MMKTTPNAESSNASTPAAVTIATRPAVGLQLFAAGLVLVSAWLVYRDVTETLALHRILDEVRTSYNVVQTPPTASGEPSGELI